MPSLLLFVLFSLSFHACDGRLLGIDNKNLSSSLHHSSKVVEDVRDTNSTTILPESVQSMPEERPEGWPAAGEGAMDETKGGDDTVGMAEDMEASEVGEGGAEGPASGVVRTESLVTVSWRVPHVKNMGHPGFNMDYDPPRTHPPSHN